MKLFFAEIKHQYPDYLFPYQVLLLVDDKDDIGKIYQAGFLPFRNRKNLFYLARSSRCRLDRFSLSSENKRILKKTKNFNYRILKMADFQYDHRVQKNCKDWASARGWKISTKSLKYIFSGQFFNQVWLWKDGSSRDKIVGYQIVYQATDFVHCAHIFYHPGHYRSGLGTRMLLEVVIWAHQKKKKFHYLGTCYGKTGFYKRSFPGFEFFNGFSWSDNLEELKYLNQREGDDYLLREKDYLEEFWQGKIDNLLKRRGVSL